MDTCKAKDIPRQLPCAKGLTDYIVLDLEGTDENRKEAQIIEIAMLKFVDGRYHSCFESLVNPGCHIGNSQIHGITDKMVKDAPHLAELMPEIAAFLADSLLVGHSPSYDTRLLQRAFAAHLDLERTFRCIDTIACVKQVFPAFKKQNLELLSSLFGFSVGVAHRAMNDTIATNRLLALCAETATDTAAMLQGAESLLPGVPKVKKSLSSRTRNPATLPLRGKHLALTGVFRTPSRRLLHLAERAGATVDKELKLSTDFLLVGQQNAPDCNESSMSTREQKARRHNASGRAHITILCEDEFFALLKTP